MQDSMIQVQVDVAAPIHVVWDAWTLPEHIVQWNMASEEWHCPRASNEVKVGGRLSATMAARDGSMEFDFGGTYTEVEVGTRLVFVMDDQRRVEIDFSTTDRGVTIVERFDSDGQYPVELQQQGWQAILDNFKIHAERISHSEDGPYGTVGC